MSQLTLEQALTSICSHVQKARADGLRAIDLRLADTRQSLGEEAYHDIFEALFRSLSLEKDNYARAKTSSTKRTALTRLEFCASAIRTSVEVLGRRISPKSLFAVSDHITAALHDLASESGKCLSSPFLKALRTLLEYPPHIERLTRKRWQKLCNFCLQSLRLLGSGADTQDSLVNTPLANGIHSGPVQASAVSRKRSFEENYGVREELELIFHLLCSSSTAPLADEGAKILIPLLEYLLPIQNLSSSSSYILGAFNIILSKSLVTDITLSQRALIEILPLIRPRSLPRSTALRKEMMITLELARSVLPYVRDVELTRLLSDKLSNLVDHLHHEYRKLSDKGFLRLDDITFTSLDTTGPMGIPGMAPRLGIARAEEAWTWVRAIASFAILLDQKDMISEFRQEDDSFDVGRPLKRRFKIIQFDNYLDSSHTADGCEKFLALQLLPFLLQERETSREDIRSLLTGLNANIQGDYDEIRSWTMVAISSIAAIKDASSELLKPLWLQTCTHVVMSSAQKFRITTPEKSIYINADLYLGTQGMGL
ncbi:Serine/threonine-protein kinase tel1 [Ascosphaera pollenicola]|nr:Serine/threonine-protein kinase tel1 [Ascosphaera pollenicola]